MGLILLWWSDNINDEEMKYVYEKNERWLDVEDPCQVDVYVVWKGCLVCFGGGVFHGRRPLAEAFIIPSRATMPCASLRCACCFALHGAVLRCEAPCCAELCYEGRFNRSRDQAGRW